MTKENNNRSDRHHSRHYAVQAMYQWQMAGGSLSDIEEEFLIHHIKKNIELNYFKELVHGVPNNQEEIDNAIKPFLNRSMSEIDPVELSVLRVATYELLKRPDVPYRVIINEALELTKKFGSVEGFKFVNGILDRIAKTTRETEMKMDKGE